MALDLTHGSAMAYETIIFGNMTPEMAAEYLRGERISIRSFSDTLRKMYPCDDIQKRLKRFFRNILIDGRKSSMDRKIQNWMSGQNQPTNREDYFRIAFALELTETQLNFLLGMCTDYTIQYRDGREAVLAWFLRNGHGYQEAVDFLSELAAAEDIKSSVTVRRLVSLMSLSNAPKIEDRVRVEAFLASSLDIEVPSSYRSIFDLAESILRDLRKVDEALYDAESLFIQSFMDWLQEWTSNNGNSLSDFLSSWKEASPKISSPDAGDSVRVMTIHKAKGLEFPYVILPFAEEITLYKASESWCVPSQTSSLPENVKSGAYKVNLSSKTDGTVFEEDYKKVQSQSNRRPFPVR